MNGMNKITCLLLFVAVGAMIVPSATAIYELSDNMTDDGAGQVSRHQIAFKLNSTLPLDGKINVEFNPGFDITIATNDTGIENIDGSYTWTKAGNKIVITRAGGSNTLPNGNFINFTLGNITSPKMGSYALVLSTTTSGGTPLENGVTAQTITFGPVTQFTINNIVTQTAGNPFSVVVTAKDKFGDVNTIFSNATAVLSSTIGAISPNIMSGTWNSNGTWTGDGEFINKTGTGTITATSGSITKTSNTFTVKPAALDSIVIASIPDQYDELPFTVTAGAYDAFGNLKTDYNVNDTLSVINNVSDAGRPLTITPDRAQFAGGIYSGTVKIDVSDTASPQRTYYGAIINIANYTGPVNKNSNLFNLSELPVDLASSTVVAYPTVVPEDGVSTSNITVTVNNSITQEIIPGVAVSIESSRGGAIDYIAVLNGVTDSTGKARFTVSSFTKGTSNITATVKGTKVLTQKATVYFGYDNKLHLAKDWNLVSVPLQLANSAISALSTTKVDRIYNYDAASKTWKYALYNKTSGTWSGTLTEINDGKGYWMFASAVTDIPIVLKPLDPLQVPPVYPLKAGWNLIGYTSLQLKPFVWLDEYIYPDLYYPSDDPMWVSAYEWTGSGFNVPGKFVITRGYWIYLKDDANLVP